MRRRVVVKVIKLSMDTKQVVARFAVGRQALAMMDHANIAKVLDAEITGEVDPRDTGFPSARESWQDRKDGPVGKPVLLVGQPSG